MKLNWKIGILIGLAAIISIAAIGVTYAANGSLCAFSWVESNDNGSNANEGGYSPIDPGDNGNDPEEAQTEGIICGRISTDIASLTTTYSSDTIIFNLNNAYPGYCPTLFFGLSNQWTTPGIVQSIDIQNPNPGLLAVDLKGIVLNQIVEAGQEAVGVLSIEVGDIPQSTQTNNYSLSVTIAVTQWVTGDNTLSINTSSLPNGRTGTAYNQALTVSNGNPPYTWSIISGSLPDGLSLDAATGAISGVPTGRGTYDFSIQVTDSTGDTAVVFLSITVPYRTGGGGASASTPTPTPTPTLSPVPASIPTPALPPTGSVAEIPPTITPPTGNPADIQPVVTPPTGTTAEIPAIFLQKLSVDPQKILVGQSADVRVTVINKGGLPGEYMVVVKLNGVVQKSQSVHLNPGQSTEVAMILMPGTSGVYTVSAGPLSDELVVNPRIVSDVTETDYWWMLCIAAGISTLLFSLIRRKRQLKEP